ncbi:hypothetical protein CV102_17690 [Natronococcus pandeyae]|uniref:Uncharacterized protein n=1 Tax=Natronococcus pandeyae TaxID=2055836 RepID=A0A8J8Q2Q2_9EURY|nr:hypothetical protein [Natronococcus pandeyae]TYL37438.1 hypothetical protein CV102_17690 [Natronococcus pandeyae]
MNANGSNNVSIAEEVVEGDIVRVRARDKTIVAEVEGVLTLPMRESVWLSPPDASERYAITHGGELVLYSDEVGAAAKYGPVEELEIAEA